MSEPIKLVLSDMDGTLLMPDHSIGPRVRDALGQLRQAGVLFSLASARPPKAMRAQVLELGIDLPTAAFNGGTLVNPDGSYLATHPIHPDAARASLELFAGHPVAVWVFADDLWLLKDTHGDYTDVEHHALGYGPTVVDDFTPYLGRIDKIVASSKDFDLLIELEHTLAPLIKGRALGVRSQDYYLDVTALLANKGDALAALAEHVGVPLAQTAVIGDGANDVAMFKRAGFSIAMGQAAQAVREQAHAVTDSNSQQGVARAIVDMILPRAARD